MYKTVQAALSKLNSEGLYQKLMILYLFFIAAFINYMLMGPTLTFMNPLFNCSFSSELQD